MKNNFDFEVSGIEMNNNNRPSPGPRWATEQLSHPQTGITSSSKSNSTPIRVNGKVVGQVRGNVFYKVVVRRKHLYRNMDGYAFDVQSLEDAEKAGAKFVQLTEKDTHDKYRVPIASIYSNGKTLDYGFGKQICCSLNYWTRITKSSAVQLPLGV